MQYPRHGDFNIRVAGDVVISELMGPWNIEAARAYIGELDAIVERELDGRRWGSVVICRDSVQFPLEMIAPLRASVEKRVTRFNQAAIAMAVAPEVEGYGVLFPTIRRIYDGLIPFDIFDTEQQACDWIKRFL